MLPGSGTDHGFLEKGMLTFYYIFSKILGGMRCMTYFSLATPVCIFEQAPYRAMTQGTCIMNSGSSPN